MLPALLVGQANRSIYDMRPQYFEACEAQYSTLDGKEDSVNVAMEPMAFMNYPRGIDFLRESLSSPPVVIESMARLPRNTPFS